MSRLTAPRRSRAVAAMLGRETSGLHRQLARWERRDGSRAQRAAADEALRCIDLMQPALRSEQAEERKRQQARNRDLR